MKIADLHTSNKQAESNPYGFIGVKHLADKYRRTQEEVINLFIDCGYSLQDTVIRMEQPGDHDFAA